MEKIEETDEEKTLILVFKRRGGGGGGQCHSTNTGLGCSNVKQQIVVLNFRIQVEINLVLVFDHYLSISFES